MKYTTGKKEAIVAFLSENCEKSFSLEEIAERITPDGKGKSTVYRLVAELVDTGDIKRLSDAKTRHCTYQYVGREECHSHLHLKCRDCGKLIHLNDKISSELTCALRTAGGFALDEGCIFYGKCISCAPHGHTHKD